VLLISLIVATLAVASLTKLLVDDRLTVGYRQWVVRKWGKESLQAYLAHCPWCTSFWVALPVMPVAVFWPNKWVIAVLSIFAARMIAGLLLDKD
jgi:hypothetical protein